MNIIKKTKNIVDMRNLYILNQGVRGGKSNCNKQGRGKLILKDSDIRPEYIEVDTFHFDSTGKVSERREEPVVRIHFHDDTRWAGTMAELKEKLTK